MKTFLRGVKVITLFTLLIGCGSDDEDNLLDSDDQASFTGRYRGIWNSETPTASFKDLSFNMELEEVNSETLQGEMFITGGSSTDGPVSVRFTSDSAVFNWESRIPGCNGSFEGSGTMEETRFNLVLTGLDCDGSHQGTIAFWKVD